jgi:IstB-like ATP binding protein
MFVACGLLLSCALLEELVVVLDIHREHLLTACAAATRPTTAMRRKAAFERRSAHLFFQLVARRYERISMLITTNQPVTQWGTVFGDEVLAAAIVDRLLHKSHTITISGESYRLKQKRKAGFFAGANLSTK